MAFLIIPLLCFVLLGGLTWVFFLPLAGEKVWKGRIDDLDVVLSVLMTADWERTHLILKVPRRVTSMKMTVPGSAVRLEMPLVTRRQKSGRDRYLAILRDLGLDPRLSSHDGDHDVLEWELDGPPAKASASIKDACARLFEDRKSIV